MPQVLKRRKERGENWGSFKARGAHRSLFSVSVLLLCHFPIFFLVCHFLILSISSKVVHIIQCVQFVHNVQNVQIAQSCPRCPKLSKMSKLSTLSLLSQLSNVVYIIQLVHIVQCCLIVQIARAIRLKLSIFLSASTSCAELKLLALLHL